MSRDLPTSQVPTTAAQAKYQLLRELGGLWKQGDRLPPLAALASQLGVGQRNTYQALRELSDLGLLVARQGKGTFVSATLDTALLTRLISETATAGDGMLPLSGKSVCILTSTDHPEAMTQQMVNAAKAELRAAGINVTRGIHPQKNDLRTLAADGNDALLFVNPNTNSPIQFDRRHKLAVVSTTAHLSVAAGEGFDLVSPSEEQGGFLAGRYLRELGCRNPAFVGCQALGNPEEYDATCQTRLRGFEAGFGDAVPVSRRFMTKRYGMSAGACALVEYQCLTHRPDGVFAASDELMIGFIMGAIAIGLHHGRDYHIVGFDGQHQFRHIDDLPATSVIVPAAELGAQAAKLLIERLQHPGTPARQLNIGCTLPAITEDKNMTEITTIRSNKTDSIVHI